MPKSKPAVAFEDEEECLDVLDGDFWKMIVIPFVRQKIGEIGPIPPAGQSEEWIGHTQTDKDM